MSPDMDEETLRLFKVYCDLSAQASERRAAEGRRLMLACVAAMLLVIVGSALMAAGVL